MELKWRSTQNQFLSVDEIKVGDQPGVYHAKVINL